MKLKLLSHTENLEQVVAMAAKLCYSQVGVDSIQENLTDENIAKFLNMLISIGHESPLEHASFTFAVEGISRACSHQLVRHRIASYSQQSQRYVKLDQFEYIVPPAIKGNKRAEEIYIDAMVKDQDTYNLLVDSLLVGYICKNQKEELVTVIKQHLIETGQEVVSDETIVDVIDNIMLKLFTEVQGKEVYEKELFNLDIMGYMSLFAKEYKRLYSKWEKVAIEDARYVFPNACETKIVFTMNTRSLFNFLHHRCCERAQWEVRELATEMLRELKKVAPILFKNIGPGCVTGNCPEGKMACGKIVEVREKFKNL